MLPTAVLAAAGVPRAELDEALSAGVVVEDAGEVALEELATAEAAIADEVLGLAEEARLALVLGDPPSGADAEVVPRVHRRSLEDVAAALQAVPPDRRVVLAGDPDLLQGAAPGAVLPDLLAWGRLPVHDLRDGGAADDALGRLPAALRRGELPDPDPADRSVVVVGCADDADVLRRAGQLVADSLPRVLGTRPEDTLVLSPLHRGVAGTVALAPALEAAARGLRVTTVHEAADGPSAEAVVLCLPAQAAGCLTRALVLNAAVLARRHLSVVTAAGDALPRAVACGVGRPRRTALARLLRASDHAGTPAAAP